MFKIQANPTFTASAKIKVPGENTYRTLQVEFKWLNRDEIKDLFDNINGRSDSEIVKELVVGWKGVDVPFSQENLDILMSNYPHAPIAIFETFYNEVMDAKRKNLQT